MNLETSQSHFTTVKEEGIEMSAAKLMTEPNEAEAQGNAPPLRLKNKEKNTEKKID